MVKKLISILISIILAVSCSLTASAAYTPSTFTVSAEGVFFANLDTKTVIYEKNADKRLYPASLTKIMTAAVVLDECKNPSETKITVSEAAILPLLGTDSSMFNLVDGEILTVEDLLYILLVRSANDAANVLAMHFGGGSISDFITKMNQKATDLGMSGSHFVNAHGLHDENHYTTPRDMYLLTSYALQNETFKKIVSTVRYTVPANNKSEQRVVPTSVLLQDPNSPVQSYYYKYANGVKTGYTDEAGRCLISTATKNGTTYICVLMKCPVYNEAGAMIRNEFGDSKALYEWAFDTFEYKQVFDVSEPIGECPVTLGKDTDHVSLVPENKVNAVLPKDADSSTITTTIKLKNSSAEAPVKKGDVLGTATISYGGDEITTVNVLAMNDVEKSSVLAFVKFFTDLFGSKTFKLILIIIFAAFALFFGYVAFINRKRKKRRHKGRKRY